jgi:class 3 adenylate cyclase/Tfp pilus assembly protein PilF
MAMLVLAFLPALAQPKASSSETRSDTAMINDLIKQSATYFSTDPGKSLQLANEAIALSKKEDFVSGEAYALKNIGIVYYYQGKYLLTLENWNESLKLLQGINDEVGVANLLSNIGALYANQGEMVKALDYHLKSLRLAEKSGNKLRILTSLNNISGVYFEKTATWDKALDYLLRALPLAEELGDKEAIGVLTGNLGEIYLGQGNEKKAVLYFKRLIDVGKDVDVPFAYNGIGKVYLQQGNPAVALTYHRKALALAEKFNENHLVPSLQGIGDVYFANGDYETALKYYKQAEAVGVQLNTFPKLREIYEQMAITYAKQNNFAKAFEYQKNLAKVKDTLFNEITQKKIGSLQFEFDLQKKEGEINLLTKDQALKETELKRQRFVKNAFAVGSIFLFMIAFIIYRNYRTKVKTNNALDHQKQQIEGLLLNILPAEVAKELQAKGHATPRNYESASVMFTDFKNFTSLADKMPPQKLVEELNDCFIAFDDIIERNNLEKIKTIGDSYMCAGGIPTENDNHVFDVVKASLEIQEYIQKTNEERTKNGRELWGVRIGIHTGPLVAGVVGKKKYAYDIWGSTVNIASRMESNGVPGQVNISSAVYEQVKDVYSCTYRGKIYAKNVGEIDMYLIDHNIERYEEKETRELRVEHRKDPELMNELDLDTNV